MSNYLDFLENKPLFYDEIDYDRMPKIWQKIKSNFSIPKIIHIIGTNGKGTTGRFLAWHLFKSGYQVGHYSSPHILEFNERIWINGENSEEGKLQEAHEFLLKILSKDDVEALSYFEYTTLMAIYIFQECDYAVMEAGMGGEFDATNVFEKVLSLVTTIDLDHQDFLGNSIEEIAYTKLKSIKNRAIIGQQIDEKIFQIAKMLQQDKNIEIKKYSDFVNRYDKIKVKKLAEKKSWPDFIKDNLLLSVAAIKFLGMRLNYSHFNDIELFGRFQKVDENIVVDVGHNVLAAERVKEALKDKKVVLIYNSYKDKEYEEILNILKPTIKRVEILPINSTRVEDQNILQNTLNRLKLENRIFEKIDKKEEYLVFGSFSVVEEFLKGYMFER